MEVYLVGGAVRDKQLGLAVSERDYVVVGATVDEMLALEFKPVGKDFPVFLHPSTHEEYALARTERKVGPGYSGFNCYSAPDVSLEDDLRRRDLTINALAEEPSGKVIDPYGGLEDLKKKLLRHISLAFREDPVRILRVARFMARFSHLGFSIAEETTCLMQDMVRSSEVSHLIPERVWQEFTRALSEPNPEAFILTLRSCGALAVVFPELDALFGVPSPSGSHPEVDTGIHALLALKKAAELSTDPVTRFAALVHDIGKAKVPEDNWPCQYAYEEAGVSIMQALATRLRLPVRYRELAVLGIRYHDQIHRVFSLEPRLLLKLLEQTDAFRRPERWKQLLDVCEADFRGHEPSVQGTYLQRIYAQAAFEAVEEVVIKSPQALGDVSGQIIGNQLRKRRISVLKNLRSSQLLRQE